MGVLIDLGEGRHNVNSKTSTLSCQPLLPVTQHFISCAQSRDQRGSQLQPRHGSALWWTRWAHHKGAGNHIHSIERTVKDRAKVLCSVFISIHIEIICVSNVSYDSVRSIVEKDFEGNGLSEKNCVHYFSKKKKTCGAILSLARWGIQVKTDEKMKTFISKRHHGLPFCVCICSCFELFSTLWCCLI